VLHQAETGAENEHEGRPFATSLPQDDLSSKSSEQEKEDVVAKRKGRSG